MLKCCLLLAVIGFSACHGNRLTDERAKSNPAIDPRPAEVPVDDEVVSTAGREPFSPLPRNFDSIGTPCDEVAETPGHTRVICGTDGTVAGIYQPVDFLGVEFPEAAVVLMDTFGRKPPGWLSGMAFGLERDRIWVRVVTCGMCRRVMGWAFLGDVHRMPTEALLELQRRLNEELVDLQQKAELPHARPLTTAGAWKAAYEKR